MTLTTPATLRGPWLAADDNVGVTEALAVVGVLVWSGALVVMVVSEILNARSRPPDQGGNRG